MQALEFAVLDGIQALLQCKVLDSFFVLTSWICDHGEIWIVIALLLAAWKKTRRFGLAMGLSLLIEFIACDNFLKPLFGRVRPYMLKDSVQILIPPPGGASFPSGHTGVSFAAVSGLYHSGCRGWKWALVLAALISFGRLYLYVHWPSDVLGGIAVGWISGWLGNFVISKVSKRLEQRK